jgi:hypothetical protein
VAAGSRLCCHHEAALVLVFLHLLAALVGWWVVSAASVGFLVAFLVLLSLGVRCWSSSFGFFLLLCFDSLPALPVNGYLLCPSQACH